MSDTASVASPRIVLLTDFGLSDGYVGVMKGVIARIAPQALCVDLSHEIAPQQIGSAAWILATSYRYFPEGTIFVCVVDPGVGSLRHPVAIDAGSWLFVGPDNGLFSYILAEQPVHGAVTLTNSAYHLPTVSSTFHGRDLFSPVAAHLAKGVPLSELGASIAASALQRLPDLVPARGQQQIRARVVHCDHFGNIVTSIPLALIPEFASALEVRLTFPSTGQAISERRRFFSDEQQGASERPFLYPDSSNYLAVAIRNGNAARVLGVTVGMQAVFEMLV